MNQIDTTGYRWYDAELTCAHDYLLPKVLSELSRLKTSAEVIRSGCRLFELGFGNGSVANEFTKRGWQVTGVDSSSDGVAQAKSRFPEIKLHEGSAYDDLATKYGKYPVVTSLEVVEHIYAPRLYATTLFSLLEPGGTAIISTPYHSYLKNLALAITGKMDSHFTALWDHGHIKFWSIKTLTILLKEAGFIDIRFVRAGRIPQLAKSMVAIARRPS